MKVETHITVDGYDVSRHRVAFLDREHATVRGAHSSEAEGTAAVRRALLVGKSHARTRYRGVSLPEHHAGHGERGIRRLRLGRRSGNRGRTSAAGFK